MKKPTQKQETLEEAAERYFPSAEKIGGENYTAYKGFIAGAKYMEKKMLELMDSYADDVMGGCTLRAKEWFEQFKHKTMKQTAVEWLAEKYNYVTWMRNRDEISAGLADEWRKHYLDQAKQMEREQHGNTWDAAIKAHDDRGHVYVRSTCDFDDYEVGS